MPLLGPDGRPIASAPKLAEPGTNSKNMIMLAPTEELPFKRHVFYYFKWLAPEGTLPRDLAAHALMTYAMQMSLQLEQAKKNLVLEEDLSNAVNALNCLATYAKLYGVTIEQMMAFWPAVSAQRRALGLSADAELPDWVRYPHKNHVVM